MTRLLVRVWELQLVSWSEKLHYFALFYRDNVAGLLQIGMNWGCFSSSKYGAIAKCALMSECSHNNLYMKRHHLVNEAIYSVNFRVKIQAFKVCICEPHIGP